MKTALSLLAVATFVLAPALSASQASTQSVVPVVPVVASGIQASADELSPEVQLHVGRGDELAGRLRFDAAAREYTRAVDVARREGHLASGTSWKLASVHFSNGNMVSAAAALDKLTDDAARVGDLEVEALSIYYSAWLNGKAGRGAEMAARVARLEGLLRSQYIPVALRDRLSGWLKIPAEVAAIGAQ